MRHPADDQRPPSPVSSEALPEVVPLLAMLLSVPLPARYPPLTLTPERQKHKTLEAVLACDGAEVVHDLEPVSVSTGFVHAQEKHRLLAVGRDKGGSYPTVFWFFH